MLKAESSIASGSPKSFNQTTRIRAEEHTPFWQGGDMILREMGGPGFINLVIVQQLDYTLRIEQASS